MNMQQMMKQVQKMQSEMMTAQQDLKEQVFTVKSVNELVTMTVTGDKKVKDIQIDPSLMDPNDCEMLQDLLITTWNEAVTQVDKATEQTMGRFTQGMNLPF